jgi:sterol 14-demethylase
MNTVAPRPTPKVSGAWPLLGHAVPFVRDTLGLLVRAHEECGDAARFSLPGKDIVLFVGPEAHEAVFRMPDEKLSPNAAYKMMVPVFGKGVVYDCAPARMGEQLGMLRPALQGGRMKHYGDLIAAETEAAIAGWGDAGVVDAYPFFQKLTSYTSSACLLGREFRDEMSDEFAAVYHDLERGISPVGYIHPYLPIPAFRRRDAARARLGEMVAEIVARRVKSGYRGEDFLQTLMDSTYADGTKLTDHEITGMLVAAMFAGHHTSAATTTWTLLELLQAPAMLAEVVAEVDTTLADGDALDMKTLRAMEKVEWSVKEALRLHPPLFILLRAALEDVEVHGFTIPKGTWVAVSPWVAHRDDRVFAEARTFDPHRFSPERAEDARAFAYIAFGGGRHKCMGNAFALLQIKTILAILLQRYDFELVGDPIGHNFGSVVIGPAEPCRLRYRRRAATP